MLELIFAAALMDTVVVPVDYGPVYVHEWGAVTFTEENVIFGANPLTDPNSDFIPPHQWDEPVSRAPIVYFYGKSFSGTFTVSVHSGNFIETLPVPQSLVSTSPVPQRQSFDAVWEIARTSTGRMEGLTDREYSSVSGEMLEIWREPPSFLLEFNDGTREKFIYYECALSPTSDDDFYPVLLQDSGPVLHPDYKGPLMRFEKNGETVTMELITSGTEYEHANDQEDNIPEILCDWAGGTMKSEELISMWETWKSWIYDGSWSGEALLVFPLPENTIEGMTTIILETDETVEYTRFYLGIMSN